MKTTRTLFWVTTGIIALVEGVGTLATANADYAKEDIYELGYPEYFRIAMIALKCIGVLVLVVPAIPAPLKEWAYGGFFINTLFAIISFSAIKGLGPDLIFPFIMMGVWAGSYFSYHKLETMSKIKSKPILSGTDL